MQASKKQFPFMKYQLPFIVISVIVFSASLYFMSIKGINFGVDFLGGIRLTYKFSKPVSEGDIRSSLDSLNLGEAQIVRFGEEKDNSYLIKVKYLEGREAPQEITAKLKSLDDQVSVLSEELVGPKVGAELRERGILAIVLTWILILVYVGFRFDFHFAPGAVVALLHDVLIAFGVFVFFGKEVNLPILAAALTILGYSINDTIVLYDRVRENLKKLPSSVSLTEIIDRSINETLARTIVTSLTVFFAVLILYFMGGAVIHDFAFFMIVGVIAGTYSTIFIASPVYLALHKLFPVKDEKRAAVKA